LELVPSLPKSFPSVTVKLHPVSRQGQNYLLLLQQRKPVINDSCFTRVSRSIGTQAHREPAGGYAIVIVKNPGSFQTGQLSIQLG